MPWTFGLMLIATLAIAGIPPFSGFFSKDEILAAAFARGAEQPVFYLFYGMGVLAALLTAFYMARLMAMTFLGENRTGEHERGHLHEAPWIMTGPLVVLGRAEPGGRRAQPAAPRRRARGARALARAGDGAGAARSARLAMPEGLDRVHADRGRGRHRRRSDSVLGVRRHAAPGPSRPRRQAPADTGFALVLNRKYYVDELYDAVVVRPLVWLSRVVLWKGVDQGVVDGAACERHGLASPRLAAGWASGCCRPGRSGVYVVLFLVGAVWILRAVIR